MHITILGTRGEIEASGPYHSRHSGILIDHTLLFDLGEQEFLRYNPSHIFITHLHPDHAYFVRSDQQFPDTSAPLYAPEAYAPKQSKNSSRGSTPIQNDVKKFSGTIHIEGYTICAIPTEHSLKVKSYAYIIATDKHRILYTGDLFWIKKKYQKLLGTLDLVITEGSYLKEGGMIRRANIKTTEQDLLQTTYGQPFGHTGIPNLIRLFAPHTKHIVLMHFGTWFYTMGARQARVALKHLGKQYNVHITVGYDGLSLDIP